MEDRDFVGLTKRILWEFFCNYISNKLSNPEEKNYRKKLTAKEEKIIHYLDFRQ